MSQPPDIPSRVSAVEVRVEEVAVDAANALHLAAAHDREVSDLAVKVDANRKAINALGVQTAARFDRLEGEMRAGFEQVDRNFAEMRGRLDQTAAGMERIVALLTRPT